MGRAGKQVDKREKVRLCYCLPVYLFLLCPLLTIDPLNLFYWFGLFDAGVAGEAQQFPKLFVIANILL